MRSDIAVCLVTVALLESAKRFVGTEFAHGAAAALIYCCALMLFRERHPTPTTEDKGREDRA